MVCHKGAIVGGAVGGTTLIGLVGLLSLLALLRRMEKKERSALEDAATAAQATEEKTIVVENKGPVDGNPGVTEVVTRGSEGTKTEQVQTGAGGAAVVSTASQGVPGEVTVEEGETVLVTTEEPVGAPEAAVIKRTTTLSPAPAPA